MTSYLLFVPLFASFLLALFLVPYWMRKAQQIGLVWDDMNKLKAEKVAGSGGMAVVIGFILGVFIYIGYTVFYIGTNNHLVEIFALLSVILFLAGIAFIDDLLGWQRGGLSKRSRIIAVLFASIPLIVINAGRSLVNIPVIGFVEFGILYPVMLVPLGIVATTTTYNFLAGFNGLEAGQGIIFLSALAFVAYVTDSSWLSLIALCMVAALCAFLFFNYCPARVFPGNSLTYAVGGLIAVLAILGNFEKIAAFFYIPYIIETILKSRGSLKKHSFGKPLEDGSLDLQYNRLYGLTHVAIWLMKRLSIKATERRVVWCIWAFQIIIILLGLFIFRQGIFGA